MKEQYGKKVLFNEEYDLDNSDFEKLEELKSKLLNKQKEIEDKLKI